MKSAIALVLVLALSSIASAAVPIDTFLWRNYDSELTGYNVYDIVVETTTDWVRTDLQLDLTSGSIYYDAMSGGSLLSPNPMYFGMFPSLQWTTYVQTPTGDDPVFHGNTVATATSLSVSWADEVDTGPGTFKVGQLAISTDADGGWFTGESSYWNLAGTFSVQSYQAVPEPATIGVLGVGALGMLLRRRK